MPVDEDLAILIQELDANSSHLETIASRISEQQFNWRPQPGAWSIGECVGHLNIVKAGDLAPLQDAIESGRARGRTGQGPFQYGFLSRKFISSMDLPVGKKHKAPKVFLPPANAVPGPTVAEFQRLNAELRRLALSANGLDLARVKTAMSAFPPPVRWFLRMPLGARLILITTHDRRHLWQAEQVRVHPDFPA
jgi:hypothetical protein